jgi:hypothetical protein
MSDSSCRSVSRHLRRSCGHNNTQQQQQHTHYGLCNV